jgi:hypothetical protein
VPGARTCPAGAWASEQEGMASAAKMPTVSPMPPAAARAALETFAQITRERYPGVVLVPLERVGPDRAVVSAAAGQVIRPFATPEDYNALVDRCSRVARLDDHRVDRA